MPRDWRAALRRPIAEEGGGWEALALDLSLPPVERIVTSAVGVGPLEALQSLERKVAHSPWISPLEKPAILEAIYARIELAVERDLLGQAA